MGRGRHRLTPEIEHAILAYVRAGGYPHVAAEAAGIPREVLHQWLGRRGARYRHFRDALMQAAAQARLGAELAILKGKALDWLRCGPGRDGPECPGWASAVRPRPAAPAQDASLASPSVQALVHILQRALEPFPEAAAAVARALEQAAANDRH